MPYAEIEPNANMANVVPTNIGAVSSRYVPLMRNILFCFVETKFISNIYKPVAEHWNGGPQVLAALYIKLCIRNSRRFNFAVCPARSFSSCFCLIRSKRTHFWHLFSM